MYPITQKKKIRSQRRNTRTRKSKPLIHNKCGPGYVKRKGYTRKNTGKYIKSSCVKGSKSKKTPKSHKSCPPGKISRAAYYSHRISKKTLKKQTIYIPSACITNRGKAGKYKGAGTGIGPLKKGELSRFGYSYKHPDSDRHSNLRHAIRELGALNIYRKLDAVAKLTVLTAPKASEVFTKDRDWVRSTYVLSEQ